MLVFYKEKKLLVISVIIILLDGLITYYIPCYYNQLSFFFPMLTISFIPFLFNGNLKKYYQLSFVIGIIYDLLYSNLFLFNAFCFLFLSKINIKLMKLFENSLLFYILLVILNIFLYDATCFLLVYLTNYQAVTLNDFFYKIEHSMLLNILSVFVYYFWLKKRIIPHKIKW